MLGCLAMAVGEFKMLLLRNIANGSIQMTEDFLATFLAWPSLRRLTADSLNWVWSSFHVGEISDLEELNILGCAADGEEYEYLFGQCPRLKTMHMSWSKDYDVYRGISWRDWAVVLESSSLENLRFEFYPTADLCSFLDESWYDQEHLSVNSPGVGSLEHLRHLKSLAVQKIALFGLFDNPDE